MCFTIQWLLQVCFFWEVKVSFMLLISVFFPPISVYFSALLTNKNQAFDSAALVFEDLITRIVSKKHHPHPLHSLPTLMAKALMLSAHQYYLLIISHYWLHHQEQFEVQFGIGTAKLDTEPSNLKQVGATSKVQ